MRSSLSPFYQAENKLPVIQMIEKESAQFPVIEMNPIPEELLDSEKKVSKEYICAQGPEDYKLFYKLPYSFKVPSNPSLYNSERMDLALGQNNPFAYKDEYSLLSENIND